MIQEPDEEAAGGYRFQSLATMLTYQKVADVPQWHRFVQFWRHNTKRWMVKYWCATLEKGKNSAQLHIHVVVQFASAKNRISSTYLFEGIRPRADPNDYMGFGKNRRKLQASINRGMFYVRSWGEVWNTFQQRDR